MTLQNLSPEQKQRIWAWLNEAYLPGTIRAIDILLSKGIDQYGAMSDHYGSRERWETEKIEQWRADLSDDHYLSAGNALKPLDVWGKPKDENEKRHHLVCADRWFNNQCYRAWWWKRFLFRHRHRFLNRLNKCLSHLGGYSPENTDSVLSWEEKSKLRKLLYDIVWGVRMKEIDIQNSISPTIQQSLKDQILIFQAAEEKLLQKLFEWVLIDEQRNMQVYHAPEVNVEMELVQVRAVSDSLTLRQEIQDQLAGVFAPPVATQTGL